MEVRIISEAIAWLGDERYLHAIVVKDSICTIEKVHLGMHYADLKPANTASQPEIIIWIFSSGHASVLGNEIRDALIMDAPAVSAAVQDMLTATRTEALYALDLMKEKKVVRGYGRQCTLQPWLNGVVVVEGSGVFAQTTLSICMEVRTISEAIAWHGDKRYVHAIVVKDSMCTIEKVHLGMYYADWKPANTASQPESIIWIFSSGHAGVLGNEIRDALIMGHPAVSAAVQEMLTRTEALYTLDLLFLEVPSPAAATIVLYAFLRSQHLV